MTKINENIKRIRKLRGLTQADLGNKIDVSPQMIAKWEKTADCSNTRYSTLQKLAIALDTDIANLLGVENGETSISQKLQTHVAKECNMAKRLEKMCRPLVKYINEECDHTQKSG
jgi:transcriptional regulator with XRE-family HTH domain